MRLLNFLSGIAPVLICLAAPEEKGGGNDTPKPAEPTGDTPEAKYTSALTIIGDYFRQLSGAFTERDQAIGQVAGLTSRAEKAEGERDTARAQVTSLTTERDNLSTQVTGLTTERDTARSRVTLIESFAKHHGLDLAGVEKFKAVTEVPEAAGAKDSKAIYDEWQRLKAAGDGKKATAYFRKHKAELAEYAESTR